MSGIISGSDPVNTGLYIETLGRFKVYRDRQALGDEIWRRRKALDLFSYFITTRSRFTAKEKIFDELWPGMDLSRANRDFKVALNALNNALDPDRSVRDISIYIQRHGTSYGLRTGAPLVVDADRFEQLLTAANQDESEQPDRAVDKYRKGLTLYSGDYLPDHIYDDWSSAERERLTSLFLLGATRLSALLIKQDQIIESVNWCQRIIAVDSLWEEAYRLQMKAYMMTNNRPLAVQVYEQCRAVLQDELGIDPMEETTRLYKDILAG